MYIIVLYDIIQFEMYRKLMIRTTVVVVMSSGTWSHIKIWGRWVQYERVGKM